MADTETKRQQWTDELYGGQFDFSGEQKGFGEAIDDFGGYIKEGISENDWIGPAIGVGAVAGGVKAAPAVAGAVPAIGAGAMGAGRFRLKAGVAVNAFDLGHVFAENIGQETEFRMDVFGGAAAAGTYYGLGAGINALSTTLSKNFKANLAIGSWSGQVDEVMKVVRQGAEEGARLQIKRDIMGTKNYKGGVKRAKVNRAWDSPKRMEKEVQKRVAKATVKVEKALEKKIKKDVLKTKSMRRTYDKILKQMATNPSKIPNLTQLLGKQFPKVAAKLAASTAGVFAPEVVSSVIGGLGLAWTAYDIYQIMEAYPGMGKQIADILFGEEPIEGDVVSSLVE